LRVETLFCTSTVNVEEVFLLFQNICLEIDLIDSFLQSLLQLIIELLFEIVLELQLLLFQLLDLTLRQGINVLIA
jgi:hypothetical protein